MVRILGFPCWGPGSILGLGTEISEAVRYDRKKKKNYIFSHGLKCQTCIVPDVGSYSGS